MNREEEKERGTGKERERIERQRQRENAIPSLENAFHLQEWSASLCPWHSFPVPLSPCPYHCPWPICVWKLYPELSGTSNPSSRFLTPDMRKWIKVGSEHLKSH